METRFAVTRFSDIDERESLQDLVLYKGTLQGCIYFILSSIVSNPNVKELSWEAFDRYIEGYQIYAGYTPSPRYNDIVFIRQYVSDNGLITK